MLVERSKHGLKAIRLVLISILLADMAVEFLQYSVQFLHRDFFQFGLLAWLLRISTFESSYPRRVVVEHVVFLFQFFCFSLLISLSTVHTSTWTWLGLVTDSFNSVSWDNIHYSVNFVFTTCGGLIFGIIQEIDHGIPKKAPKQAN